VQDFDHLHVVGDVVVAIAIFGIILPTKFGPRIWSRMLVKYSISSFITTISSWMKRSIEQKSTCCDPLSARFCRCTCRPTCSLRRTFPRDRLSSPRVNPTGWRPYQLLGPKLQWIYIPTLQHLQFCKYIPLYFTKAAGGRMDTGL